MSTFFALVLLVAFVVSIVFFLKAAKVRKQGGDQKPNMKKGLISLLVFFISFILLGVTAPKTDISSEKSEESDAKVEDTAEVVENTEETKEGEESTEATTEEVEDVEAIELIAGELGEYGKEITMSEGTDLEENLIVYYVPAGTYTVENVGDYMTQVTVYEGITSNSETGYDEYTSVGDVKMIDKGATADIEVPDGWFIEIHEPTHIKLTAK